MKLSKHEHHRVLQAHFSTGRKGFEFQFYCQECFHPADHLKLDDIEYILNEHAQLEEDNALLEAIQKLDKWSIKQLETENETLRQKLLAIECGDCHKTMLECACDD